MKKLIAALLCLLMLVPCASAEYDPNALRAGLESYLAELTQESASLQADIDYLSAAIANAQAQLDEMNAEAARLAEEMAAIEQVLESLPGPTLTGKHYVQMDIADYGTIVLELDADAAPITVTNFMGLVESGFYDGLTFHRIISGFMIQGGDPKGNGTGGSSERIKGEFSANGVANPITHERGVISMARSSAPDSASSQFFIMHAQSPWLDGQYAAFGRVLTGMEVVDAICEAVAVTDSNGTVAKENQPVITSIKVIQKPE